MQRKTTSSATAWWTKTADQTMDATDTRAREDRSRGCYQAGLYDARRPHQAPNHHAPIAAWREGINGLIDAAVDMTLRLDNAEALPTCPQPQQQRQTALLQRDIKKSEPPGLQLTRRSRRPAHGVHLTISVTRLPLVLHTTLPPSNAVSDAWPPTRVGSALMLIYYVQLPV